MIKMVRIATIAFSLFILAACAAVPVKESGKIEIKPTGIHEECASMHRGQWIVYAFEASERVDFNIHYHASQKIFYPVEKQNNINEAGSISSHSFDLGADEYFQMQRDTAYKRMNVDSSFVRIPYIVEKKKKLTPDLLAEKAAKRLMELRDGKHLILTGEANVFPQSDAAINEINRMEKSYTELFTGKTISETYSFSYQVIPSKTMVGKPVTLFQFSDQTGPVSGTMKGGNPVAMEFAPEKKVKGLAVLNRVQSKSEGKKYDKLFYRVPDVVDIKISKGSEKLFDSRKLIYQFGEVIQLPANYIIGK